MNAISPRGRRGEPPRRIDQPAPGLFKLRLARGAPFVCAEIRYSMGFWSAAINGAPCGDRHPDPVHAAGVSRIWENGASITRAEYEALLANPPAAPDRRVDLGALPPIDFGEPPPPAIGHNGGPAAIDLAAALEPRALAAWLAEQFDPHAARADELLAAHVRFLAATAAGITAPAIGERAADFARQIREAVRETDATRVEIKAPVLAAQRAIDGAAKAIAEPLDAAVIEIERRVSIFMAAVERVRREEAKAAADRAEEAAYYAQQRAEETGGEDDFAAADAAIAEQAAAQSIAESAPGELARMKTALGGSASLGTSWSYTVDDLSRVPVHLLSINDKAVKAALKAGTRTIPGLTITASAKARIR
jgi:hypothetical protein